MPRLSSLGCSALDAESVGPFLTERKGGRQECGAASRTAATASLSSVTAWAACRAWAALHVECPSGTAGIDPQAGRPAPGVMNPSALSVAATDRHVAPDSRRAGARRPTTRERSEGGRPNRRPVALATARAWRVRSRTCSRSSSATGREYGKAEPARWAGGVEAKIEDGERPPVAVRSIREGEHVRNAAAQPGEVGRHEHVRLPAVEGRGRLPEARPILRGDPSGHPFVSDGVNRDVSHRNGVGPATLDLCGDPVSLVRLLGAGDSGVCDASACLAGGHLLPRVPGSVY